MDYSKFVTAVLEQNRDVLNEYSVVISKVLVKFLLVRMDASLEDAQDSAQNTILFTIEKIKNDELQHPDRIIHYLFTTAKNDYLKNQEKIKEQNYDQIPEHYAKEGDQLNKLLNEERQSILKKCLTKLKEKQLKYITYWFKHPRAETEVVASYFGLSINNAWTKKHRIIQVLKGCVEKNINK